ncbi:hypothetical protein [Pseudoduganella violacea]|uniref:Transmembrane protein n=1 Tax=Pseudoduganella violacea TaxID=1715466 RepID=A0A7W5B8B5_9BURK|nr:hypothetical protein [Pseudoduganella violacea]MBB3118378.1 hypothetical protein [Pseudoduganella violacea]
MHFPSDLPTILKLIGSAFAGLGSLILAWRAKHILEWVTNCLVIHDNNIKELFNRMDGLRQEHEVVLGASSVLLNIQDKLGFLLFILGFFFLGAGMLCNAVSYIASP